MRCNSLLCSQFTYCGPDPVHKYLTLVVDDGIQPPVELSCKDRNIMAATFIRFLHKNIGWCDTNTAPFLYLLTTVLCGRGFSGNEMSFSVGGSETFQDKVNFFQRELRHIHSKKPRTKTCLKITRHSILDSVSALTLTDLWNIRTHAAYRCCLFPVVLEGHAELLCV